MNKKFQYIFIFYLFFTFHFSLLNATVEQAIATAIIDDELQYKANSIIKNSFFSITLDNQPLKIPAPKGLPLEEPFLKPGSRPGSTYVKPNPTLKLYFNTPNGQTLVYEVKLDGNDDNYNSSNAELKQNEKQKSFTFDFDFSQFSSANNKNKPIQINLQTAIVYPTGNFPLARYFIILYNKP